MPRRRATDAIIGPPTESRLPPPQALRARLDQVARLLADAPPDLDGVRLVWRRADGTVDSAAIVPGAVLGRDAECALRHSDPRLSRQHCCFHRTPEGRWFIEDLGSTNGTFVNGERVQRGELCAGDVLALGAAEFVFLD